MADSKGKAVSDLFEVAWRPFQLNSEAPLEGVSKKKMYEERFGVERTRMMSERLAGVGAELGIKFSMGGKTGNTLQSHRLVELALETGGTELQNKVIENVFKLYFEDDGDVTCTESLIECGVLGGMSREAVTAMLVDASATPSSSAVSQNISHYREKYRVSGVPFFVIGNQRFSGAQDSETIAAVLEEAL